MLFDFSRFSHIVHSVYPKTDYSESEALRMFRYYLQKYESAFGVAHPPLRVSRIIRIIQEMPWVTDEAARLYYEAVPPDAYERMIDLYFTEKYGKSDRNIWRFFGGRARSLCFYEVCF